MGGGRRSRYRGIVGASAGVSITNVEMEESKYFRERYCCANNIRSLSIGEVLEKQRLEWPSGDVTLL